MKEYLEGIMGFIKKHIVIIRKTLIWGVFLSLPLFFIPDLVELDKRGNIPIHANLFSGLLAILIYYFNYDYIIPKYYQEKKFVAYVGYLLLAILIAFIILRGYLYLIGGPSQTLAFSNIKRLTGSLLPRAVLVIIAAHYMYSREKSRKTIREKEGAQLQLLKSQIAPHFLFNTLNSLYSLAIVKSDKTAQGILQLSALMRYIVSETQAEKVSLKTEIRQLQNYLNLQKTRLTDETEVIFTVTGNYYSLEIAPLLLLVFVENAFKYGISTEDKETILIDLKIKESRFYFKVSNSKVSLMNEESSTGIGLKNVKTRLDLIYGSKHSLLIAENEDSFEVNLEIELQ